MKRYVKCWIVIAGLLGFLCFMTGCEDDAVGNVRFKNNSGSKTVYAVWDGSRTANLAPGETSGYQHANPGTHTIQWKNAANNGDLTSMGWPNLVEGESYTFPYGD